MQHNPVGFWGRDPELGVAQKATLGVGAANCTHALDQFIRNLHMDDRAFKRCAKDGRCGCGVMLAELEKSGPSYDVLGRLDSASRIPYNTYMSPPCRTSFTGLIKAQLDAERARLAEHFQLVPEVVQSHERP